VKPTRSTCRSLAVGMLACLLLAGCGAKEVTVTGKLLVNGQPFKPKSPEDLQIILRPKDPKGVMCLAEVAMDGTFKVQGPTGNNLPVGAYRVEIAAFSDNFKGEFTGEKSPLLLEVKDSPSTQKIVIDVGKKTVVFE
jgi:hypothetical protein